VVGQRLSRSDGRMADAMRQTAGLSDEELDTCLEGDQSLG